MSSAWLLTRSFSRTQLYWVHTVVIWRAKWMARHGDLGRVQAAVLEPNPLHLVLGGPRLDTVVDLVGVHFNLTAMVSRVPVDIFRGPSADRRTIAWHHNWGSSWNQSNPGAI